MINFYNMTKHEMLGYVEDLKHNPPQTREEVSQVLNLALFLVEQINHQFDEIFESLASDHFTNLYGERWSGLFYEHESYMEDGTNDSWVLTGEVTLLKGYKLYEWYNEYANRTTLIAVPERQ